MKNKKVSISGLKQLFQAVRQKKNYLKSIAQTSLFQYRSINLIQNSQHLLQFIIWTIENNIDGPILKSIITKPQLFYNSLLGYCFKNQDLLKNESYITVSHQQAYSQSLLLALLLAKQCNNKVDFVGLDKSFKGLSHLIADQTEADRVGYLKSAAEKEGIIIHCIQDWEPQTWINQSSVIVIDIFELHPIKYRPFLLKYFSEINKAKKVILYHSHLQDEQVFNQLKQIKSQSSCWLPLQLWLQNPLQNILQVDDKAILKKLFFFLKQEMIHPQKNDVAIFIPADTHVKRFASKLSELLSKHQLKDSVNIILKPHQPQPINKNNIFLVTTTAQLVDWDYDFNHLFYVLDFQTQTRYLYDYSLCAYVRSVSRCSGVEKARRMSFFGSNRIGRYVCLSTEIGNNLHYIQTATELETYIVKMLHFGLSQYIQKQNQRVKKCLDLLQSLEIIEFWQEEYRIKAYSILKAVKNKINCIHAKQVLNILQDNQLQADQKCKLANLMIMLLQVLKRSESLYKYKAGAEMMTNKKIDSIWKTSGYVQSCLQVITKCENIDLQVSKLGQQLTEVQNFKRLSSRISSDDQNNIFGSLFQLCEFDNASENIMQIPAFLKNNLVNQEVFCQIRQTIEHFREVLGIRLVQIIFEKEDLFKLFKRILRSIPTAIASYTGYKRRGYVYQKQNLNVKLSMENLHAKSKQNPQYLFVCGLNKIYDQYQIMYANAINSQLLLQIFGTLPIKKFQSLGEAQLQFHGIPTSIFEQLLFKQQQVLNTFENQYNCLVESSQQLAMFTLHSEKQKSEQIKIAFENLLNKTKERIANVKKSFNYLGHVSLVMGPGGQIQYITKSKQIINKCLVCNLHCDVSKSDLQELFQQFFHLRGLVLNDPYPGLETKTAFVKFYTQKDYENFKESFDNCLYFGLQMKISPLKSLESNQPKTKAEKYLEFRWYVYQSHGKAFVRFSKVVDAIKVYQSLIINPIIDQNKVIVTRIQSSIFIQNLKPYTDQIYLQQFMKGYGEIQEIEIMKSPIRQPTNPDNQIENLFKKTQGYNTNIYFNLQPVERKANGLRICCMNLDQYLNSAFFNSVVAAYDKKIGILGQGRLHVTLYAQKSLLIPHGLTKLYLQILQQVLNDLPYNPFVTTNIVKEQHQQYIVLTGKVQNQLQRTFVQLRVRTCPNLIKFSKIQKNLLFNGLALSNIMYIEEKYHCKIIVDLFQKDVRIICAKKVLKQIEKQMRDKVTNNFFYILRLNSKAYKYFKKSPNQILKLKQKFKLTTLSLQNDSYSLLINGGVQNVQDTLTYLMHFTESFVKPQQLRVNPDLCGICCDPFIKAYRLQRCSHLFCTGCLKGCFKAALNDANLFPIKCPHCLELLTLRDIEANLILNEWQKLKTIAINKYIGLNSQKTRFCYTVGCKQINILDGPVWQCQTCKIKYCNLCKETYHPGIKCEDVVVVRQSDQYFKKYLLENGGRLCPNPGCKMPVVKIDGCNKVLCTRCQKSMCFKCPPQKMIPYDSPSDCYDHLTKQHGGYY